MIEIESLQVLQENPLPRETHCAIGAFDGVHLGHQAVIGRMLTGAAAAQAAALVFTFRNHPLELLAPPYAPKKLMSLAQKRAVFAGLGVEYLVMPEFDLPLAQTPPETFVREILLAACRMQKIYCGFDFRFGHRGAGTPADLQNWARSGGFAAEICPAVHDGEQNISSSQIRNLLEAGHVSAAGQLLTRPYELEGTIVAGQKRGRTLGFPTANLAVDPARLIPGPGVYAVTVLARGQWRGAMLNLGPAPTFGEEQQRLEAHLFDFDGDLYGAEVRVRFHELLRGIKRFDSPQALIEQLQHDEQTARKILGRVQ